MRDLRECRIHGDDLEGIFSPMVRCGIGVCVSGMLVSGMLVSGILASGDDAVEPDDSAADHEAVRIAPDIVGCGFEDRGAHLRAEDAIVVGEELGARADVNLAPCGREQRELTRDATASWSFRFSAS
jgi:hypothetical protein